TAYRDTFTPPLHDALPISWSLRQTPFLALTMSSLDLRDMINQSRIEAGESPHESRKFLAKVEDELDDLTGKKFRLNNNQTKTGRSEEHTSELQSRFDLVCR